MTIPVAHRTAEGNQKIQQGLSILRDVCLETGNDEGLWLVLTMKKDIEMYLSKIEQLLLPPAEKVQWPH